MILAIDTSTSQCAVALADGDAVETRQREMTRGHAEALFPMIDELVGGRFDALTRIAVCTGPGSFTGIRIGVAAARGLALGCGIPCIGISRFEALAAGKGAVTVVLDGRAGTLFAQPFTDGISTGEATIVTDLPGGALIGDGVPDAPEGAGLPDPAVIAALALSRADGPLPAPLYLRDAAADPPREGPPVMLD
ncbi:tRNA (adenosine(37)-N6)-threonylcarbamoyltransferase complex dimerization subunit type 1 TsaB [Rhodobacteraceae bacterium NNCM2]|nr:tRNA (adenosine(37)-N6)-threonylcarbamoyltransferase complex dimerization subunit type 1 TsaB [Coraliihabitans acroporae]